MSLHNYNRIFLCFFFIFISISCFKTETNDEHLFKQAKNEAILSDFITRNASDSQLDSMMFMVFLSKGKWQPGIEDESIRVDFLAVSWPTCVVLDDIDPDRDYCQAYMIDGYIVHVCANEFKSELPSLINIKTDQTLLEQLSKDAIADKSR